ncbi:hypothetical protein [Micromonospora coriariae]|uniref:hypothetical protein n=1 Tax=Micromonospora coriariae TaxID=285665 RepID=UPI000B5AE144|nr:hypothetical protein [Micromonospora coriariae]
MLVLAVAILAGCGNLPASTGYSPPRDREPVIHAAWTSCAEEFEPNADDWGRYPALLGDGFHPVSAVVCAREERDQPDGGRDRVEVESRVDDIGAIVGALRLPDEPRSGEGCGDGSRNPPWLVLLDRDGRWLRPGVPVNDCGLPRVEVLDAGEALRLTVVRTRVVEQIISGAAAKAGCQQRWRDEFRPSPQEREDGQYLPSPPVGLPAPELATLTVVCRYRMSDTRQGDPTIAEFERGSKVPSDRVAELNGRLVWSTPAKPCTAHATRFVSLSAVVNRGDYVYIEVDGCMRMLTVVGGIHVLTQADSDLPALLAAF